MPSLAQGRERLARHYLEVARAADRLYLQGVDGIKYGLVLFDQEWPQIRQGQAWAAARAPERDEAARLTLHYPIACARCLELRPPRDQIFWLEAAVSAARRLPDREAEAECLVHLGLAYAEQGDPRRGIATHEQAIAIFREALNQRGEGACLAALGMIYGRLGDQRSALHYYEQALAQVLCNQTANHCQSRKTEL